MKFLKRLGWQLLSFGLMILRFCRFSLMWLCALQEFWYLCAIIDVWRASKDLKLVPTGIYVQIILVIIGMIVLHYLKQYLINTQEYIKDRILENTNFHFSQEKLIKFKKDMRQGTIQSYTFEEIYAMTKFLEQRGETVVANLDQISSINEAIDVDEHNFEISNGTDSRDDEIISKKELASYIHKGVSNPQKALDELIGLENVKEQVRKMQNRYLFEIKRAKTGVKTELSTCNHMCFIGPAGTGKTSVARIMSGILYELKIIRKNQVLEISGNDLQGQYVGHTGKKTKRIVEAARGGVLFIDEAYTLSSGGYSDEALGELVKAMEDYKDDLVVIFAGYEREMNVFLKQNSGMESRIKSYIYFTNYSPRELAEIFIFMAKNARFSVSEQFIQTYMDYAKEILLKNEYFGNARTVRKNLDDTVEKHADNVVSGKISEAQLNILGIEDFPYFKQ